MNTRSGGLAVVGAVLVWTLAVAPALGAGAATTGTPSAACEGVCVEDVRLSADRLVAGETATLEATVTNAGDAPANATIALEVTGPDGETDSYALDRSPLDAGESRTVAQALNANTTGTHRLRLVVYGDSVFERHDASPTRTLVVAERGLGGDLDRSEYALGALVGAVGVAGVVVRRVR